MLVKLTVGNVAGAEDWASAGDLGPLLEQQVC